ncbi:uncharacterized protein LOC120625047 [Pararge aegeria]|uniref:uncharacterized protein LOC120625047 n=1 Tax=Pararge aegeria TaxID=116150 RepID=UPI0019D256C6|nr:uncharacterized protein LOC120625047 [Pararge aegeria]
MIKGNLRNGDDSDNNPLIYINNPVESKIPKAYLTLEEFKEVLTNRIKLQRNELTTKESLSIGFNKAKNTSSNIYKANSMNILSNDISKANKRAISTLSTKEPKITNTVATRNISINIATEISRISRTSKQAVTEKSIKTYSTKKLDEINVSKENIVPEIESAIPNNVTEPKNESINTHTADVKTKLDETTTQKISTEISATLMNGAKILRNIELPNDNKLINQTTIQADVVLTTTFGMRNKEHSTAIMKFSDQSTSHFRNEMGSSGYEMMSTKVLPSKVATEEVGTVIIRNKFKPKRMTTQKVSSKVSRKRSTLSRPLVFMGS